MNKEQFQTELIERISQIDDEEILKDLLAFIQILENDRSLNELSEPKQSYRRKTDFSDLHQELKMRSLAVSSGEFITQEDLENESENW